VSPMKRLALPILSLLVLWALAGVYVSTHYGDAPVTAHWNKRWWNNEAAIHFINTLSRYHGRTASQHWFAFSAPSCNPLRIDSPCVRGGQAGKPGSAVVPSHKLGGEDVYISFPPGSAIIASMFVFPSAELFHIKPLTALRGFNWSLCLLTALLFLFTLHRVSSCDSPYGNWMAFLATLPLLVSVESLHSHHLSLWAHQVFQPILALTFFFSVGAMTLRRSAGLGALCAIACWIEWTAYLLIAALSMFVFGRSSTHHRVRNVAAFFGVAVLGLVSLLIYYEQLVGLNSYFSMLSSRFTARAVVDYYTWLDWLVSIRQSYGSWMLVSVPAIILGGLAVVASSGRRVFAPGREKSLLALLLVSAFLLLENVLMFEHSIVYTFDRLKIAFTLSFMLMFLGTKIIQRYAAAGFYFVFLLTVLGTYLSYTEFNELYRRYW
jgi:hypothetical protein